MRTCKFSYFCDRNFRFLKACIQILKSNQIR